MGLSKSLGARLATEAVEPVLRLEVLLDLCAPLLDLLERVEVLELLSDVVELIEHSDFSFTRKVSLLSAAVAADEVNTRTVQEAGQWTQKMPLPV